MALSLLFAAAFTVESTLATGQRVVETVEIPETNHVVQFVWPRARIPKDAVSVKVTPDFARAKKGESGYFVLPSGHLGTFREEEGEFSVPTDLMPLWGMNRSSPIRIRASDRPLALWRSSTLTSY